MPTTPAAPRLADDRCPGVLRLVEAADGLLARIRFPGGLITSTQLRVLATSTDVVGDGRLELTSRGNLQVRGMSAHDAARLAVRVGAAGLLPAPERDRIRNVLASPLAGIDNDLDLTRLVGDLDLRLQCDPGLDALSGRFLFGFDDGRGDIAAQRPDVLAVVGRDACSVEGVECPAGEVVERMVAAAGVFLQLVGAGPRSPGGGSPWRVRDLDGGRSAFRAALGHGPVEEDAARPLPAPLGRTARADGGTALVVAPPLGRLTSEQARWIADRTTGQVLRVTPWRSIVLPHAPSGDPAAAGLVTGSDSPWRLVSACAGRPRCANALADVQADAAGALGGEPGRRVHWAGCERCCGRTDDVEVTMIATAGGYRREARVVA